MINYESSFFHLYLRNKKKKPTHKLIDQKEHIDLDSNQTKEKA
jgi:hypothetical protein